MNYEKVKLFLAFNGLLEYLTQEEEEYIAEEMKNHFTNAELGHLHGLKTLKTT